MSFLLWTSCATCTGCTGNHTKFWKALALQLLSVCTSLQSGTRKESWVKMHNWSWSEGVSASSSPSPFSPVSLLFIMDLTQSTLVTDRIIALKYMLSTHKAMSRATISNGRRLMILGGQSSTCSSLCSSTYSQPSSHAWS